MALAGECVFEIDGKQLKLSENEFILIPPDKRHRMLCASEDFEKFVWGFSVCDKNVSDKIAGIGEKVLCRAADVSMKNAAELILDNASNGLFEGYSIVRGQMYFIFVSVLRKMNFAFENTQMPKIKGGVLTDSVRKFILDNIALEFSLKDIADNFFLSERQLCRICKAESGKTVREIKVEIRLEYIRKLLSETKFSIEEIAVGSGFSDRYSMSKFFKKHEGMSPAVYRASLKK